MSRSCTADRRRRFAVLLVLVAGTALLPVCGVAEAQSAGEWGSSEQLWRDTCRYCHDNHIARELRGAGIAPAAVVTAVRTGPKAMPSFLPSEISDQELAQLAEWVSMQKAPAAQSIDQTSRRSRHESRQRSR